MKMPASQVLMRNRTASMATRTNAHEEQLASLRSVMNVISILDQSSSRRAAQNNGFDLRALIPTTWATETDESWDDFCLPAPVRPIGTGDLRS
jgi:hypothetical protein